MIIDYVALSHGRLEYSRNNTLSATQQAKPANKKGLIQSRASKIRNSNDGMLIADKYTGLTPKSFTIDNKAFERRFEKRNDSPIQASSPWLEHAREEIEIDGRPTYAFLMERSQIKRGRGAPLPRGKADTDYMKIVLVDVESSEKIEQIDLTPADCQRLVKLKPSHMSGHQQLMTIEEISKGTAQMFDTTQQELLKKVGGFERNEDVWRSILRNVIYDYSEDVFKFNVWNICEGKETPKSNANKSLSIKSKLNSSSKKPRVNMLNSAQIVADQLDADSNLDPVECDMQPRGADSKVDG